MWFYIRPTISEIDQFKWELLVREIPRLLNFDFSFIRKYYILFEPPKSKENGKTPDTFNRLRIFHFHF